METHSNGISAAAKPQTNGHGKTKFPSIVEVKNAIPGRLFDSNLPLSLYFVLKDVVLTILVFAVFKSLELWVLPPYLQLVAVPIYWYVQGIMFTAIFVLGHDCGHSSFSKYDLVNDVFGTILHTFLLTPFYPWKVSHKNHHKNTANIDKDEVFYPIRKKYQSEKSIFYLFGLGLGWFVYLWNGYFPRQVNHFDPRESMFKKHVVGCTLSVLSLVAWASSLCVFVYWWGLLNVIHYYVIPDIVFATWLVIITFLHHNEEEVPWYADSEWDYVGGQLSSIDRHYGHAHGLIHNIGTHQIHHLFSKVPHYHLEEATRYFRKAFPDYVRSSDEPILPSLVRMFAKFKDQFIIENDVLIHVYK